MQLLNKHGFWLSAAGGTPPSATNLSALMQRSIEDAALVIADITGSDPYVMYELGFSHALRKPMLMVLEMGTPEAVPTHLLGYVYFYYDPYNPSELLRFVDIWIRNQKFQVFLTQKSS